MAPGDYFLPYTKLIEYIVWDQLIKTDYYPKEEKDELMQKVYMYLLEREDKILGSFQNRSKFSFFLCVIISNFCNGLIRKRIKEKSKVAGSEIPEKNSGYLFQKDTNPDPEQQMVLKEYCKKLYYILQTYPKNRQKLNICFKALFHIPILPNDFSFKDTRIEQKEIINQYLGILNSHKGKLTDQEIYASLTTIFNSVEKKKKTKDAIRKWIKYKMSEIIALLNGDPPRSAFDKETFQYLFEYCYKKWE